MQISLSTGDRRGLAEAADALLSPLAHPTLEDWQRLVTRRLRDLVRGGEAIFVMPREGRPSAFELDAPAAKAVFEHQVTYRDGEFQTGDPVMDAYVRGAAQQGVVAFTTSLMEQLTGAPLARSVLYNEVMVPTFSRSIAGLTASTPEGRVQLAIFFPRLSTLDADSKYRLPVLELLVPAFRAALRTYCADVRRAGATSASPLSVLDGSRDGALVLDAETGRELYRNRTFATLVESNAERDAIVAAVRRVARATWHVQRAGNGERRVPLCRDGSSPAPVEDVATPGHLYVVHATHLPSSLGLPDNAVLVMVESSAPSLPKAEELRRRFGLTAREAEVALLLARGLSDALIAERLGLSVHTVGHHAERVFDRMGVHTRKAMALELLGIRGR